MNAAWELLACPVCRQPMKKDGERALRCAGGHSFDLSAEGYVNLLLNARLGAGDDRRMVAARRRFLEKGYYACLRAALGRAALEQAAGRAEVSVVDAGCGEGYYTDGVACALRSRGRSVRALGVDLSKPAVRLAARRRGGACYAVAGIFSLPVRDACADLVLSVFAPVAGGEFRRVLRPGGRLIVVSPGPRHLDRLKEILYDRPYENGPARLDLPGLTPVGSARTGAAIRVDNPDDIRDLFAMTPYFWRTPAAGARRLESVSSLETSVEFDLHIFAKPL